jgi:hypothetical protein
MKFRATLVFEFSAHEIGEAGKRLNELFEEAEQHRLETRSIGFPRLMARR